MPGVKVDLVKYGKNEVVDSAQSDDQGMVDDYLILSFLCKPKMF